MTDTKKTEKVAEAKPAPEAPKRVIAHDAVVGAGDTDTIRYSSAKPSKQKKVLTVLHVQRALMDRDYSEAIAAPGGNYEALTTRAVQAYQRDRGEDATGVLTREQFADLFTDDPNVTVELDTHEDHAV
ncbi:hypothetical protein SEA_PAULODIABOLI_387 [Microbacterium phage PauloDiaboli]|nr:hypothetical protein SEA_PAULODIABOLI_32 [Microbacterium phage PauloDiaboli]QIG58068.1 hypothetical protein SEA_PAULODIABOLI_387 [Microbacterium phage PauloDiaboli]QWY83882.1 hypothetical protein SEA_A3WALLY_32 [Microbacterium phage A3Wally]QWY84192.1 hypothetical protein SEA_A3WALLY_385 [Microbacterium phage A3Wally]